MLKYNEKNLFDRVGYEEEKATHGISEFTDKYYTMSDGTKLPVMTHKVKPNDGLSRHLVLKTFFGYIPIENINTIADIFFGEYLKDETVWMKPYNEKFSYHNEEVKRLSLVLGKHWKKD